MLQINQKLLDHVKEWEGLRLKAYDDLQPNVTITNKNQVKGTLTIGYGHTKNVTVGQTITEQQANELLMQDVEPFASNVLKKVTAPLTENMFNALVSFAYNVGNGNFNTSTLLKKVNLEDYTGASNEFKKWISSKGHVLIGLVKRREAEKSLFLRDMFILSYFKPDGSMIEKKKSSQ